MTKILSLIITLCLLVNLAFGQDDLFIKKTSDYLEELAEDDNFSLSICIAKAGEVVLEKAYGYASREHQVRNQVDTKFNTASIGKLFTAVAIMQLHERGQINLHRPLGHYLPQFPNRYIRDSVTAHQLLTHTSGLPLWFHENFDQSPKFDYLELNDYRSAYETLNIDKTRTGSHHYSNVGYVLLGFLIEAVSKKSYKAYLNQHIFNPLEMQATDIWQLTEIISNVATGYVRPSSPEDWWKTNYHLNMGSSPAGGAYSSVKDLVKFFHGLQSNKLMNDKSKQLMLSPKTTSYQGEYGYGIGITKRNDKVIIGHPGGYYGIRGELMWYQNDNYVVSILANSDHTDYIDVSYFIKVALTGTVAEKAAYQNTSQLIRSLDFSQIESRQELEAMPQADGFDELLIQIKGYYHYNNQAYDKAEKLFYLNTILFPDSQSAQRDLKKVRG